MNEQGMKKTRCHDFIRIEDGEKATPRKRRRQETEGKMSLRIEAPNVTAVVELIKQQN
jgi:hypothetical protein